MAQYYYLVSSLPMLKPEETPFLSSREFLEICADKLSAKDFSALSAISLVPDESAAFPADSAAAKWNTWEICLRNRIAAHRTGKGQDASEYMLPETDCFSEIEAGVQEAYGIKNPLERENIFDRMRWRKLDDLEAGHDFDFDKLCIYMLKLLLREKWLIRSKENGFNNLDGAIAKIYSEQNNHK